MPYDSSLENIAAAQHALDFAIGWFADPIYLGHYPPYMSEVLKERLPRFSDAEIKLVKGSADYYGMNTYTTNLCRAGGDDEFQGLVDYTFVRPDGTQLGNQAHCAWLQDYPQGFRSLLNYLWKRYKLPIYVTENGFAVKDEDKLPLPDLINDEQRVDYFRGTLQSLRAAVVEDGVDVRAYLGWSFLDNFEWADGYGTRFGMTHVDYNTQERTPKKSGKFVVKWFKEHVATSPPILLRDGTKHHSSATTSGSSSTDEAVDSTDSDDAKATDTEDDRHEIVAKADLSLVTRIRAYFARCVAAVVGLLGFRR